MKDGDVPVDIKEHNLLSQNGSHTVSVTEDLMKVIVLLID